MLHTRANASLSPGRVNPARIGQQALLAGAAVSFDVMTRAYARVIADHCDPVSPGFVPGLGLGRVEFSALLQTYFSYFEAPRDWLKAQSAPVGGGGALEEYADLVQLLSEHCIAGSDMQRWVIYLVAAACMGDNHLWQDLGLPHRAALSELMNSHFPALAAKNIGDMKWKKFFYKQLCERADIFICKAPVCNVCSDYDHCFGPEDVAGHDGASQQPD